MTNRRNFIKQSGVLAAGLMMNFSCKPRTASQIGIQLYTLRDQVGNDPGAVFSKVAAAGYGKVETYGYENARFFGKTAKEFGGLLKNNNLTSPSGHYGMDKFLFDNGNGDDVKELIDVANTLGQEYIVIPHLEEQRRTTIAQYQRIVGKMNEAGTLCKAGGVQLGYHNHDFEFMPLEGSSGYTVLLKESDPSLVKLEMDIYWVVRAGQDPLDLMTKHPGRFTQWHVKDMSKTNRDENTEIGNGTIDFKKIFASTQLSGLQHFYLEQESNYKPDAYGSIAASAQYISQNLV